MLIMWCQKVLISVEVEAEYEKDGAEKVFSMVSLK